VKSVKNIIKGLSGAVKKKIPTKSKSKSKIACDKKEPKRTK